MLELSFPLYEEIICWSIFTKSNSVQISPDWVFRIGPAVFMLVYIWLCECLICLILLNDNTRLWLLSICFLAFIYLIFFCSKSFNIVALVMVELLCFLCSTPKCSLSLQTSASLKTQEIGLGLWGPTTSKKQTNNKERFKILTCQKYKW